MSDQPAITVNHVSKTFQLPHEKVTSIKSAVINFYRRNRTYERQEVLSDISFEVKKGEFFGIVGRNGSGKSTLLKMLAGIYSPTKGELLVHGKLTPFIELGVGFNPELSGRENVFLNGALLGFNRSEVKAMYGDIVSFAELEMFMDQKLKNYSSGMQVRLAFSIAIRARSDILLLDEVLAVGDAAFQKKCFDYFMQLKKDKRTVVLVTHDMGAVRQYCDRAIMINNGLLLAEGSAEEVAQSYQKFFSDKEANAKPAEDKEDRWGDGKVIASSTTVKVAGDTVTLTATFSAHKSVPAPLYGFSVYNAAGVNILESNTKRLAYKTQSLKAGEDVRLSWTMPNIFSDGSYDVSVACCDQSAVNYYDWLNKATSFRIDKKEHTAGIVDPAFRFDLQQSEGVKNG